jgi:ribosomal protein L40E
MAKILNCKPKICVECGASFKPKGGKATRCHTCREEENMRPKRIRVRRSEITCIICTIPFKPKRLGISVCPTCLVRREKPLDEKIILEPGPCRTCRSHVTDERGIMLCSQKMYKPCSELNPDHDCGQRIPERKAEEPEENITDTLIRKAGILLHKIDG